MEAALRGASELKQKLGLMQVGMREGAGGWEGAGRKGRGVGAEMPPRLSRSLRPLTDRPFLTLLLPLELMPAGRVGQGLCTHCPPPTHTHPPNKCPPG